MSHEPNHFTAPVVPVQEGIQAGIGGFSAPISTPTPAPVSITADDLTSPTPITPVIPQETSPITAANADATFIAATPEEKGVSDLISQIVKSQETTVGKTAFTAEQQKVQGISELETAQTDIANQILMLQAQEKNVEAEAQKGAEGRGITVGGLAPQIAGRQREIGIQANVLSAQLAASQNKLALADRRVKLAVEAKFGPQEEDIKAKIANLDLLLKDPKLDLATKNRANAQALILKQKEAEIAKAKEATTAIWAVSTTAAQNISNFKPTNQYTTSAQALSAIQNAKTKEEALSIATATGLTKTPIGGIKPIGKGEGIGMPDTTVQTYADLLAQGKISLANVPQNIRNAVVTASGGIITKPLSDTAIKEIQQSESAVSNLTALKQIVESNLQFVGPISGFARFNPYSKARQVQAEIDRVRQQVGKTLEGGVLRKEDEEKYKKILATLADTPETALYKIDSLIGAIQRDVETYKGLQQETGRFVPGQEKTSPELLRKKYKY